jgi:16S rRNA C967 or C1407 C5-methylase (RsmB/RsmF family)
MRLPRSHVFRELSGVAVTLVHRVYEQRICGEALNARLRGAIMLQNLPSVVAARALSPAPGSRVLDMCASPGGKTSALAALMRNEGSITALDVNALKVAQIRALCAEMGASIVTAHRMDATKAVALPASASASQAAADREAAQPGAIGDVEDIHGRAKGAEKIAARLARKQAGGHRVQAGPHDAAAPAAAAAAAPAAAPEPATAPFPPESFDAIMLDAPCSALGLRPRLLQPVSVKELRRASALQRSLFHAAVALLRPGGALVFSTCTINPLENEANVGWALATFPCLTLAPHGPRLGGPGLTAPAAGGEAWLTAEQAALVQRFSPDVSDTIGFFVARFEKKMS